MATWQFNMRNCNAASVKTSNVSQCFPFFPVFSCFPIFPSVSHFSQYFPVFSGVFQTVLSVRHRH